jgi:hypothetical protein
MVPMTVVALSGCSLSGSGKDGLIDALNHDSKMTAQTSDMHIYPVVSGKLADANIKGINDFRLDFHVLSDKKSNRGFVGMKVKFVQNGKPITFDGEIQTIDKNVFIPFSFVKELSDKILASDPNYHDLLESIISNQKGDLKTTFIELNSTNLENGQTQVAQFSPAEEKVAQKGVQSILSRFMKGMSEDRFEKNGDTISFSLTLEDAAPLLDAITQEVKNNDAFANYVIKASKEQMTKEEFISKLDQAKSKLPSKLEQYAGKILKDQRIDLYKAIKYKMHFTLDNGTILKYKSEFVLSDKKEGEFVLHIDSETKDGADFNKIEKPKTIIPFESLFGSVNQ